MRNVTVVESPVAVPAGPLNVGGVSFVALTAAGAVSVTAGAKSAAVEKVVGLRVLAVNAARELCTPEPAATSATSIVTARPDLMPGGPRRPPPRPRATARPGPRSRRAARGRR